MKTVLLTALLACCALPSLAKVSPITVSIWPKLAPGETTTELGKDTGDHSGNILRLTEVTAPRLFIYPVDTKHPKPTVLIFPGGGYSILAADLEGTEITEWLNSEGYTAAVLHYRVPGKREGAFQDAQRALSYLRANAKQYGIDSKHLGVLGFSAGGHLTVHLACGYDKRAYEPVDKIDKVSCRPDFALPIYPAYLIDNSTHQPAPEVKPHAGMPPVFMVQTLDDPILCAPEYAKALEEAKIPHKLVTYDKGGHGYGIRAAADQPIHNWPTEAAKWLKEQVSKK